MRDFKAAAAGEMSESDYSVSRRAVSLTLIEEVLEWLIARTRAEMTGEERAKWIVMLSKIPEWKLRRFDEYPGAFINGVWEFFDKLQPVIEPVRAPRMLPEPLTGVSKDVLAHVHAVMSFQGTREERLKLEMQGIKNLQAKYPDAGFESMLQEKRFQGITF